MLKQVKVSFVDAASFEANARLSYHSRTLESNAFDSAKEGSLGAAVCDVLKVFQELLEVRTCFSLTVFIYRIYAIR